MKAMNPSEAIYGFVAWLSSQKEITQIGSTCDCAPLVEKIALFCKINNLPEVSEDWPDNLIHPT